MVFVARMIRASKDLEDFKIVMVDDRIDLEDRLAGTAKLIGSRVNVIGSTADLRAHLSTDASDANMAMVRKFMDRLEAPDLNPVEQVFAKIDHLLRGNAPRSCLGIAVECVMTDNATCYRSFAFRQACRRLPRPGSPDSAVHRLPYLPFPSRILIIRRLSDIQTGQRAP